MMRAPARTIAPIVALALAFGSAEARAEALSPQQAAGRAIYQQGTAPQAIVARLSGTDFDLPASHFACTQCHGEQGGGTREGGVETPPLTWSALSAPNRRRAAFDPGSFARAVCEGVNPAGRTLHPVMPRYALSPVQSEQLVAYLRIIGSDDDGDPGVTTARLRIGTALPLRGPLAPLGTELQSTLQDLVVAANAAGGAYGRTFELVIEDSTTGTLAATRRLVEERGVFALVANYQPGARRDVDDYLRAAAVPSIGPLALSSGDAEQPNELVFQLLPTLGDQAEVLADYASSSMKRALVVALDAPAQREAADVLRRHAGPLAIAGEIRYAAGHFDAEAVLARSSMKDIDCIVFLGDHDSLLDLAVRIDTRGAHLPLLLPSVMLGDALSAMPESVRRDLLLASPVPVDSIDESEIVHPAARAMAQAAFSILVEATRRAGRRISRHGLVAALEQLQDFAPGTFPPVTFRNGRRVGSTGSCVVRPDRDGSRLIPVSEWLVPQGRR